MRFFWHLMFNYHDYSIICISGTVLAILNNSEQLHTSWTIRPSLILYMRHILSICVGSRSLMEENFIPRWSRGMHLYQT
jgi:hypothetical protein